MLMAVAFFVTVAWLAREVQAMRERAGTERVLAELRTTQANLREGARRLAEDLFVMQHLLAERKIIADSDMLRGRTRLIDTPRRRAQEKRALTRHLKGRPVHLMVEDRDGNVH